MRLTPTAGEDCPKCGSFGVFSIDRETGPGNEGYRRCEGCLTYWNPAGEEVPESEVPDVDNPKGCVRVTEEE